MFVICNVSSAANVLFCTDHEFSTHFSLSSIFVTETRARKDMLIFPTIKKIENRTMRKSSIVTFYVGLSFMKDSFSRKCLYFMGRKI